MFARLWTWNSEEGKESYLDIPDVIKVNVGNGWFIIKDRRGFIHDIAGNPLDGFTYLQKKHNSLQFYADDVDKKEIG